MGHGLFRQRNAQNITNLSSELYAFWCELKSVDDFGEESWVVGWHNFCL